MDMINKLIVQHPLVKLNERITDLERQLAEVQQSLTAWKIMREKAEGERESYRLGEFRWREEAQRIAAEKNELERQLAEAQKTEEIIKVHLVEFYNDWQKGDFDLPRLAQFDLMSCMEAAGCGPLLEKMGADAEKEGK